MLRQIKSKQEIDKKRRTNQIIVGAVLIGLMLVSTLGYSFLENNGNSARKESYNGLIFYQQGQVWQTQIGESVFNFQNLPKDVENVSVIGNFSLSDYNNEIIYVVNNNYAFQEIGTNIGNSALRIQAACLNNTNCTLYPVKTCADNLFVFEESNETKVVKNNHCVYIYGDFYRGADAFLYRILGII